MHMGNQSMDDYYEKVRMTAQDEEMELGLKKHVLNALAEIAVGDLMGLKVNDDPERWAYGDPGVDFKKDGLTFDVVYNPDPKGDLYLHLDKPHIADVYILATGNDVEMIIIGWAYREDFYDRSKMTKKIDGNREMITIPQKHLRHTDNFKWYHE